MRARRFAATVHTLGDRNPVYLSPCMAVTGTVEDGRVREIRDSLLQSSPRKSRLAEDGLPQIIIINASIRQYERLVAKPVLTRADLLAIPE